MDLIYIVKDRMLSGSSYFMLRTTSLDVTLTLVRARGHRFSLYTLVHNGRKFYLSESTSKMSPGFDANALILPCRDHAVDAVREWMEMGALLNEPSHDIPYPCMPYYFTQDLVAYSTLEPKGTVGRVFGGAVTPEMDMRIRANAEFYMRGGPRHPEADDVPHARYNCMSIALGLAQNVGGIDIAAVDPALVTMTRSSQLHGWRVRNLWNPKDDVSVMRDSTDNTPLLAKLPPGAFITGEKPLTHEQINGMRARQAALIP